MQILDDRTDSVVMVKILVIQHLPGLPRLGYMDLLVHQQDEVLLNLVQEHKFQHYILHIDNLFSLNML